MIFLFFRKIISQILYTRLPNIKTIKIGKLYIHKTQLKIKAVNNEKNKLKT